MTHLTEAHAAWRAACLLEVVIVNDAVIRRIAAPADSVSVGLGHDEASMLRCIMQILPCEQQDLNVGTADQTTHAAVSAPLAASAAHVDLTVRRLPTCVEANPGHARIRCVTALRRASPLGDV